jgi:DUF2934 family protein
MTVKLKSRKRRSREPDCPGDIEERIRQRAYDLYEQRGRAEGSALKDWLQAETEMLGAQKQRAIRATKESR